MTCDYEDEVHKILTFFTPRAYQSLMKVGQITFLFVEALAKSLSQRVFGQNEEKDVILPCKNY